LHLQLRCRRDQREARLRVGETIELAVGEHALMAALDDALRLHLAL
jgi:hypothetical protein